MRNTPAPWQIKRHYDAPNTYTPFIEVGPARICFTQGYHTAEEDAAFKARAEADAALVGTALPMLEALRSAEFAVAELCYGQDPANQCWVTLTEIRAAIAAAEGKTA